VTSGFNNYRRVFGMTVLLVGMVAAVAPGFVRPAVSAGQAAATDKPIDHPEFPVGDGRDVTLKICSKCHSPNIILASGRDRTGWENTITKMVRLGAVGTDEDYSEIADYLTDHFPPSAVQKIFVNMATEKQLADVLGISPDEAKAIIVVRDKEKGFKSIDDLKKVPNVDVKKIDAKKDVLVF
jgi:competence protein ComEA